jgi:hypothetical protein
MIAHFAKLTKQHSSTGIEKTLKVILRLPRRNFRARQPDIVSFSKVFHAVGSIKASHVATLDGGR